MRGGRHSTTDNLRGKHNARTHPRRGRRPARGRVLTGQSPIRTGLTKVGLPGAAEGMSPQDPTIATLPRPLG